MNLENSTPDTSSGQGASTPEVSSQGTSGQGSYTPEAASGQGTQTGNSTTQSVDAGGLSPAAIAELDKRTSHYNQKITELANQRAEMQRQLQAFQQQQEQRNQALAQALGYGTQQTQQTDIVSELIDNPGRLNEIIQQEAQKLVEPIQQKLVSRETNEYLQTELNEKASIKEQLRASGKFSDQFIEQALDVSNMVNPEIFRDQAKLQDPMVPMAEKQRIQAQIEQGIANFIRQSGGIRRLIHSKLGEQFTTNLDDITQQLVQSERQKQFAMNRSRTYAGMSGGAQTQAPQRGSVNYRTEYL